MAGGRPRPYRRRMAAAPPTSRLARTGRFGGLVAGQGLRWAGTQAANRVRSPERAEAATGERAAALARELVEQLGHMRGAAMKIGQVLSTIDFTAIPASEREAFKQTLAALRDDVPPLPVRQGREARAQPSSAGRCRSTSPSSTRRRSPPPRSARSTAR